MLQFIVFSVICKNSKTTKNMLPSTCSWNEVLVLVMEGHPAQNTTKNTTLLEQCYLSEMHNGMVVEKGTV